MIRRAKWDFISLPIFRWGERWWWWWWWWWELVRWRPNAMDWWVVFWGTRLVGGIASSTSVVLGLARAQRRPRLYVLSSPRIEGKERKETGWWIGDRLEMRADEVSVEAWSLWQGFWLWEGAVSWFWRGGFPGRDGDGWGGEGVKFGGWGQCLLDQRMEVRSECVWCGFEVASLGCCRRFVAGVRAETDSVLDGALGGKMDDDGDFGGLLCIIVYYGLEDRSRRCRRMCIQLCELLPWGDIAWWW